MEDVPQPSTGELLATPSAHKCKLGVEFARHVLLRADMKCTRTMTILKTLYFLNIEIVTDGIVLAHYKMIGVSWQRAVALGGASQRNPPAQRSLTTNLLLISNCRGCGNNFV